ncbi:MAG: hypothetical protein L0H73_18060 [Nitrococcus sp.]|nr:hypothetical protein [Nitrococcus sp.]
MFARIRRWFAKNKEWRHAHEEAWSQSVTTGADDLTPFQRQASDRLCAEIKSITLQKVGPGQGEAYLMGELPDSHATVFIYTDGAEIYAESKTVFSAERWDYQTPHELVQKFVEAAQKSAT